MGLLILCSRTPVALIGVDLSPLLEPDFLGEPPAGPRPLLTRPCEELPHCGGLGTVERYDCRVFSAAGPAAEWDGGGVPYGDSKDAGKPQRGAGPAGPSPPPDDILLYSSPAPRSPSVSQPPPQFYLLKLSGVIVYLIWEVYGLPF